MEKISMKVDAFKIFQEIVAADTTGEITLALRLIWGILEGVAKRALETDDKEMIKYMVRLCIIDVTKGDESAFLES